MRNRVFLVSAFLLTCAPSSHCWSAELDARSKDNLTAVSDLEKDQLPLPLQQPAHLPEYARTPFLCLRTKLFRLTFAKEPWAGNVSIRKGPTTGFAIVSRAMPQIETVALDAATRRYLRSGLTVLLAQVESHQKQLEVFSSFGLGKSLISKKIGWFRGPLGAFTLVVGFIRADRTYNEFADSVKDVAPKIVEGLGEGTSIARVLIVLPGANGRSYLRDSRFLLNPNGSTLELERCYYILKP
ncbi:hypothetical protein GFM44_23310 [Rhizobium leguminosarum bv. viciae]|nr:hypothetical protein [Rhizobium leguminosarum bv. viciae]